MGIERGVDVHDTLRWKRMTAIAPAGAASGLRQT